MVKRSGMSVADFRTYKFQRMSSYLFITVSYLCGIELYELDGWPWIRRVAKLDRIL